LHELERSRIKRRYGRERLVGRGREETRSAMRNGPREQQVRVLEVQTRTAEGPHDARKARWLDADSPHHVAAPAEVGVRNEQAVELRLVAQAGARHAEPVVRGHRDGVRAQLRDDPARVRDPLAIRRRRRTRAAARGECGHDEHDGGLPEHAAIIVRFGQRSLSS
jgi:hypothetical protein